MINPRTRGREWRGTGARAGTLAISLAILLTACSSAADPSTSESQPPAEAVWTLEPIQTTDDTAPIGVSNDLRVARSQLFDDTAGGFWANSGSTWWHFGATAELIDRVERPVLESRWGLSGIDAVSPTRLAVGAVWNDGGLFGDILLADMVTGEQSVVLHQECPVGNLAVFDDTVVFVSYAPGETGSFDVSRVNLTTGVREDLATLEGSGATADLDVGADGTIYVASDVASVTMGSDGTVVNIVERRAANPQVAVSAAGDLMWMDAAVTMATPFRIDGGSAQAREIIAQESLCGNEHLGVVRGGTRIDLAALCKAAGAVWLGNEAIVVSVGDEDGAPLIKVTPPPAAASEPEEE